MCVAMGWWTPPIILFFLMGDGMRFVSDFVQIRGEIFPDIFLWSADRWTYIAHYVQVLTLAKKIELHGLRDHMARGSLG